MLLQLETSVSASFLECFGCSFVFGIFLKESWEMYVFFLNFVTTLLLFKIEKSFFQILNELQLGSRNRGTAVQTHSKMHKQVQENFTFSGESNGICDFRTIFCKPLNGLT